MQHPRLRNLIAAVALMLLSLALVGETSGAAEGSDAPAATSSEPTQSLADLLAALPLASYADKRTLIQHLAERHDQAARAILGGLLEGNLYTRSSDSRVYLATGEGTALNLTDPETGKPAGRESSDNLTK